MLVITSAFHISELEDVRLSSVSRNFFMVQILMLALTSGVLFPLFFSLKSMQSEVHCVQRHDSAVMQEVNCTEAVSMATWSGSAGVMKTRTVSFLVLLRAQPGNPPAEGEGSNQYILDYPFTPIISYTADIKKHCLSFPTLLQMLQVLAYQQVCSLRIGQLQDQERPGHQPLNKQVKVSGSCAASSLIPDW